MVNTTLIDEIKDTIKLQVKVKDMTQEEKKEHKRVIHREYMRKRRQEPEFYARMLELNRDRKKFLYHNDEEYKNKQKERVNKHKEEGIKYKKLYEDLVEAQNV